MKRNQLLVGILSLIFLLSLTTGCGDDSGNDPLPNQNQSQENQSEENQSEENQSQENQSEVNQSQVNQSQENQSEFLECTAPEEECAGGCVDFTTDVDHCGECGFSCGWGQSCEAGTCTDICSAELDYCSGDCVDIFVDNDHCGACDFACPGGTTCEDGLCHLLADSLYAGGSLNCATVTSGETVCWGISVYDLFNDALPMDLQQISIGASAACIMLDDDTLVCEDVGNRGIENAPSGDFQSVAVGVYHACGIRDLGTLVCWGENPEGVEVLDPPAGNFIDVTSAFFHSCAIEAGNQEVQCWGSNTYGELDVPSGGFRQVVSGVSFACGIRLDDTVVCWGDTQVGTLQPTPSGTFSQLAAAGDFVCGVRANGTLECWGSDNTVSEEKLDPPAGQYRDVAVGSFHACAINVEDDRVNCWGSGVGAEVPAF